MELAFFFSHISRAQRLAPPRTRTRVIQLGAQCTDHWTTGQSRGVGVPVVQLTTYVKSTSCTVGHTVIRSCGHKSKFFWLDRLLLPFFIIMCYTLRAPLLLVIHNEFVHVDILERSLRQLSLDLPGLTLTVILSLNSS